MRGKIFFKKPDNTKRYRGCKATGTFTRGWWECKLVQSLCKTSWQFLVKLKMHLTHDPAIPLLDIYPTEMKTQVYTKTCT